MADQQLALVDYSLWYPDILLIPAQDEVVHWGIANRFYASCCRHNAWIDACHYSPSIVDSTTAPIQHMVSDSVNFTTASIETNLCLHTSLFATECNIACVGTQRSICEAAHTTDHISPTCQALFSDLESPDEIERAPAGLQDWPDDVIASDNELKKHGKYVCNISKTLGSDTGSIKRDDERAQVWKILDEKESMESTESSVLMCHLTKREGKSNRVCGKLFRRKEHLTRHMKTASVHNERGYGPCAVFGCGKSSSRRDNLQDHYWTHLHKNVRPGRNKKLSLEELRNILCPDEETLYLRLAQRLRDHQNREHMTGRRKARTSRYTLLRNDHNIVSPTVERFSLDAD